MSVSNTFVGKSKRIASPQAYLTNIPATETPFSEAGKWINTGLDWTLVAAAGGVIHGTQDGSPTPPFTDSYAMFTGNVGNDYRVEATVFLASGITTRFLEIEIQLRWQQHAHYATGYEFTLAHDHEYDGCGTWPADGSLGTLGTQYRTIVAATPPHGPTGLQNGDIYYAQVVGNVFHVGIIRAGVDTPMYSFTDTDPDFRATGQPGVGFFRDDNTGSAGNPADGAKAGFSQVRIIPL